MKTVEIEKTVLSLPPKKRARIASRLLESLSAEADRNHGVKWGEEAEARVQAFEAGRLSARAASEVLAYRGKSSK